jgi:hypothetical protein
LSTFFRGGSARAAIGRPSKRRNLRGYAPQLRSFSPIAHQHSPTRAIAEAADAIYFAEKSTYAGGALYMRPPFQVS